MTLDQTLRQRLDARCRHNLYREVKTLDSVPGPLARVNGRELLAFCSNDYLGLATRPEVIRAQQTGAELGTGATASHLVNGHLQIHQQLQHKLAEVTGREAALVFSSGYMANLGTLCALLGRADNIISDKFNHASLIDGARLCGAYSLRFPHNDLEGLHRQLQRAAGRGGNTLVAVDGVYSMDGDLAPMAEIAGLCRAYGAWLMVDEAHGFGVMGSEQWPLAGSCAAVGLGQSEVQAIMGTLGKAAGNAGAFVAGSRTLIDYLVQFARPYIYTTGMPPAVAAGCVAAIDLMRSEPQLARRLEENIAYFRRRAAQQQLPLTDAPGAIQPLPIGCAETVMTVSAALERRGFMVGAIRPPTVPAGTARLRITLSACHSHCQIDALLDALSAVLRENHAVCR
ncbi:8-amino-7-oxononanoate synthase [Microbulbifer spongiae]|uniref:8-amino-7-oxononanoate synthase n=1 Tax=Microbulbifer spongiae TaxID=2944933 RepID=A0ABY9ECK4_9GAMM|nr:8-amino-7-oxononanoate synthase [Microbulbifer sp. MI-G]WKD50096.1 8-amino-7-oxononanoate synthase [Microbulbifer sp. MI-G]